MNKELLISIKPEHLVNILNGKKTRELRTRVPKDYKGWVIIYCTKTGLYELIHHKRVDLDFLGLYDKDEYYSLFDRRIQFDRFGEILNGKVVARFWFDEYDDIVYTIKNEYVGCNGNTLSDWPIGSFYLDKLQLTYKDILDYGKCKDLYAWHIKKLEIFDEPKELSEFYKNDSKWSVRYYIGGITDCILLEKYPLTKAPQSYQFVYVKENKNER